MKVSLYIENTLCRLFKPYKIYCVTINLIPLSSTLWEKKCPIWNVPHGRTSELEVNDIDVDFDFGNRRSYIFKQTYCF